MLLAVAHGESFLESMLGKAFYRPLTGKYANKSLEISNTTESTLPNNGNESMSTLPDTIATWNPTELQLSDNSTTEKISNSNETSTQKD